MEKITDLESIRNCIVAVVFSWIFAVVCIVVMKIIREESWLLYAVYTVVLCSLLTVLVISRIV